VSNAILGNIRGQSPNDIHYFLSPGIEPDEIFAEIDHEMRQSKIAGKNVTLIVDTADTTPEPLVRSILERLFLDYQLETVTSGLPILPAELRPIVLIDDTLYCQYEVDWNYYRIKDFSKWVSIVRAKYHLPAPIASSECFINRLSNRHFNTSDYFSQILNGKLNDFITFMGTINNKHVVAEYQDIYVSSPASAILACRVVKGFLESSGCSLDRFTINTSNVFQRPGTTINQDFDYATDRDDYVNNECFPDILNLDSSSTGVLNTSGYLPHFRQLHIYNSEFDFYIIPDGGISNGWLLKDGANAYPPRTTPCTTDFTMSMRYGVPYLIFVVSWAKRIAPRSIVQTPVGTTLAPTGPVSTRTVPPLRRKIHLPAPAPTQKGTSFSLTDKMKDILEKIDDIVSANGYEHFYPNGLPTILLSNEEPPLLKDNPQLKQWPNWMNDDRRHNQISPQIDRFKEADEELLLGVYKSHEEKVVLYEKGIRWFVDVFMRNYPNAKENLFTIVLAHEIGHWITHKLHPNNSSEEWDTQVFDDCYAFDKSLLEGWAQLITIWGIAGDGDLIDAFKCLLLHQSSPYHAFVGKENLAQADVMNTLSRLRDIRPFAKLSDW
jgi:hypothetical protein